MKNLPFIRAVRDLVKPRLILSAANLLPYKRGPNNDDGAFRSFILDFEYVDNGKDVFRHGANKELLFGSDNFNSPVAFLIMDVALNRIYKNRNKKTKK